MKQTRSKLRAHVHVYLKIYVCFMFASSCKHPISGHPLSASANSYWTQDVPVAKKLQRK